MQERQIWYKRFLADWILCHRWYFFINLGQVPAWLDRHLKKEWTILGDTSGVIFIKDLVKSLTGYKIPYGKSKGPNHVKSCVKSIYYSTVNFLIMSVFLNSKVAKLISYLYVFHYKFTRWFFLYLYTQSYIYFPCQCYTFLHANLKENTDRNLKLN
jgi:hypothetical protein